MLRRRVLVFQTWETGFHGVDYEMQARRSYVHAYVRDGGYVVPRPPDPTGVPLPSDAELRLPERQPEPEARPLSPEPPPR
eukprot:2869960-Alexandrium_andersonii.AAC.1